MGAAAKAAGKTAGLPRCRDAGAPGTGKRRALQARRRAGGQPVAAAAATAESASLASSPYPLLSTRLLL